MATKKLNKPSKAKMVKGQAKGAGDLGGKFSPEEALSAKDSGANVSKKKAKKGGYKPSNKAGEPKD
jgi:hypothetical protein